MNTVITLNGVAFCGPDFLNSRDGLHLRLSDRWALGSDNLQWIIYRWRGKGKGWRPISFVTSNKGVLVRVIAEHGITLTPEATATLSTFPETFREWLATSRNFEKPLPENLENDSNRFSAERLAGRELAAIDTKKKRAKARI